MDPYEPVACHLHDLYEIAIMGGQRLQICWHNGKTRRNEAFRPLDLQTADSAEWLLVENNRGGRLRIRLDWIQSIQPL